MDVEHVDCQVIGGQVERLKHLLQRHLLVARLSKFDNQTKLINITQIFFNLADWNVTVCLQGLLDEPQEVLLVHAGSSVDVCVHLNKSLAKTGIFFSPF